MRLVLALLLAGCGSTHFGFELPEGYCRPADHDRRPWEARHYAMTVPDDAPRRGSARPRVVIQVFSDFQCPFCARAVPTLERVLEEYGGCVQVVWRQRPLSYHEHARLAAIASHEVYLQSGDEAFWRFHNLLFENQEHIARADLLRYAEALGVDMEAFTRALDSEAHAAIIERDRAAIVALPGELDLGTPSFFVNGTLLHGARSYRQLAYRIEEALADDYASEGSN